MILRTLDERLVTGSAPTADDLPGLAAAGVRTIIDLRAHREPRPHGSSPWEEAVIARRAGLVYRQLPVEPPVLNDALALVIRRAVAVAAPRVLLHCTTGRRAGVFGLIVVACEQPLTVEECLERGRSLGLDFDTMPRLTAFLRRYVLQHGARYRDAARAEGHPSADYQV